MFDTRRREFITLLGGAAAWPFVARAQQPERMRRIGVLMAYAESDPERSATSRAFLQGLQEFGLGRRPQCAHRVSLGPSNLDRIRSSRQSSWGCNPMLSSPKPRWLWQHFSEQTRTIPIVFLQIVDPVGAASSRAWHGLAATSPGSPHFEFSISHEMAGVAQGDRAAVTRVATIMNPARPPGLALAGAIEAVAPSLRGGGRCPLRVRDAAEIERAVADFAREPNGGLIVPPDTHYNPSRADHRAGGPAPPARGLRRPLLRHGRRPDVLWARFVDQYPARGRLCRPHPQGREASRPSGAGADQVRAGHQPQDRQGARPRPCRRRCSPAPTR